MNGNDSYPPQFDLQTERKSIDKLLSEWEDEKTNVQTRREVRENKRNVKEEQQKGTILKDETIIPDRTVNTNIHRGRVPYIQYITQSKRLLILEDVDDPNVFTEPLEMWFTRGMRYPDWKMPWFRQVDCTMCHGGCALEVVYDESKPFNCAIEYIPREALIFNRKTRNIQACPRVLRLYEISLLELDELSIKHNFDAGTVTMIKDKHKNNEDYICIYKELLKRDGAVYNAWYSADAPNNWLRAPILHDIGLFDYEKEIIIQSLMLGTWPTFRQAYAKPFILKEYPIVWFPFDVTENEEILQTQGRTALDIQEQEALTHMITNAVNGSTRASHFYPTAELEPGNDAKLEELGPLKPGVVMSGKISTFQPEWPNNFLLSVVQVIDQRKAQQTGNTDYAAIARKDANKTATEMQLALQQHQSINMTEIDIFSSPFLTIYTTCFNIARDQAIYLLCKPPPKEHFALLFGDYHVFPAGDVEVLKRIEDRERAKEFFNIVRGTPLAEKLFEFLIQQFFPDEASDWIKVLNTPDLKTIIRQLLEVLVSVPTDELTPEQRTAFQTVVIAAQNVVGTGDNEEVPQVPPQQTAGTASTSNAPVATA